MSDTPKLSVALSSDPRKWIPAIIGAVILGEALWSLFQLLLRDWAVPAITNLMGQGPTQNQNAFLAQPLLIAFVEACLAGILLVALMAWSTRRSWTVRVAVEPSSIPVAPPGPVVPAARVAPAIAAPSAPAAPVAAPVIATPVVAPPAAPRVVPPPAPEIPRVIEPQPVRAVVTEPIPSPSISNMETANLAGEPLPTVPASAPAKPPAPAPAPVKSKKPKKVYYNIVGEPIESDD